MRTVFNALLGGALSVAIAGAAFAQAVKPAAVAASAPATAASRTIPDRNPAITAAENAKEPGVQRPEERVIPQISLPLTRRNGSDPVANTASAPAGSGTVDDSAARCLAAGTALQRAACERAAAASTPVKPSR